MSNKTSHYPARFCGTIFLIAFFCLTAFPQELAEIAGTVKDSNGFPIPNAVVDVRQQETMLLRSTRSADSGTYFIDRLPIGSYTIEITHPGFTKAVSKYGDPSGDITVPAQFGIIQSTINTTPIGTGTPRQVQFMLRVSF
jgi:hypothetical protein